MEPKRLSSSLSNSTNCSVIVVTSVAIGLALSVLDEFAQPVLLLKNHRGTMALQCLAIVGKVNEPLYLKDVKGSTETESDNDEVDAFGFVTEQSRQELSLRKEFMIHSAIDSLEEALYVHNQGKGRSNNAADASKWIGILCPMEESYVYGYVTSTNVRFLAMVSDSLEPSREVHLKTLFAKLHNLYVEYMLNPWSALQLRIKSTRFDRGVDDAIRHYNDTNGIAWA